VTWISILIRGSTKFAQIAVPKKSCLTKISIWGQ